MLNGSTTSVPKRVGVIGGGITGLSAAYQLATDGHDVTLFERSGTLGGKVAETTIGGIRIPTAPDNYLARRPEATELIRELGLTAKLNSPAASSARIYRDGHLHRLPPNVLGIPATSDLDVTGLISTDGAARAGRRQADDQIDHETDESVGSLVRRHLGDEVLEFLVDPLLGGINAGDSDQLSVVAGVPQIDALRRRDPRLLDAAKAFIEEAKQVTELTGPRPVFHSVDGGLMRLVEALTNALTQSDRVDIQTGVSPHLQQTDFGWVVDADTFDDIIVTIPAYACSELLADIDPELADLLSQIDYSSVALTILVIDPASHSIDPSISGVLVPRSLGFHVTAASFSTHKWPRLTVEGDHVLRVSTGRRTDRRWQALTDDELVAHIEDDLTEILGATISHSAAHVTRWIDALPQYDVGHKHLIADIDTTLERHLGLHLTGAWRDGLGLPACIGTGRRAARAV